MHAVSHQIKRAHLANTRRNKRLVAHIPGMTPARFDVMYHLRQKALKYGTSIARTMPGSDFQKGIVIELALHPSTVSKMLAALERLGWIKRVRFMLNRRYKVIDVTALGLKRIWMAMRLLWRQRPLLREFERLARQFFPDRHVLDGLDYLYLLIEAIARDRGDECRLWFDYGSRTVFDAWVPVKENNDWRDELNRSCH